MKLRIVSSRYFLDDTLCWKYYHEQINSVTPLKLYTPWAPGKPGQNTVLEIDIDTVEQLADISKAIDKDIVFSSLTTSHPFCELWIEDD